MAAQAHTFRGYVVREQLGSDGQVRCYLCYDPSRGKDVLLQTFDLIAPGALETFLRESRLRIGLSHLNLLESVDAWIEGEVACAVFAVDFDETIADVMEHGPRLSVAVIFRLIRDVCRGLGHARAHGITHLDISPANLWVRREVWTVRIGGLQLPAAADLRPESTAERARLDYLSPEQRAGDDGDERSDVFRAGLVLYELLSDRQLFLQTIGALGRERAPAPLPNVGNLRNVNLDVVLAQALAADPAERFPDLATFEHELDYIARQTHELLRGSASTSPLDTDTTLGLPPSKLSEASPTKTPNKAFDERVQFTVFRPKSVVPEQWDYLLVFAHLGEARVDAPADEPEPMEEVQRQARSVLGDISAYADRTADSLHPVPTEGELLLVPYAEGIEFNPRRRAFLWTESVHREQFRFRADRALDGRVVHGRLSIYLGAIILAEIALTMKVESRISSTRKDAVAARPYRKVFASYSHRDREIVEEFSQYARAIGDRYLQDVIDLRSGERWQSSLESLIKDADIFQLFWSWNALESPAVREEWQYALRLARPWFIRPVYWDDPLPSQGDLPPQALLSLHFQRVRPRGFARPADGLPLSVGPTRDTYVPATPPKPKPETLLLPSPLPAARLEITDALGRRIVPIAKSPFHIGRRETNDLRLTGSEVSRDHAQITIDGNGFTLHDVNTRYGTYVNGEQVTERMLVHGDRVRLGRTGGVEMVFLLADTQPPVGPATTTAAGDLRQIAALLEGLRALGSGRVLDDVLSQVLDSAIEVSGAERGFIMLTLESVDLEFKMARGRGHTTLSGGSFATSRKIPEEVFRTGEPRIVADLLDGDLADVHDGTVALGIRSVLCVPLHLVRYVDKAENVGEERRIGVLYLDSKERGSLLSGSTRAALETLAIDAAVAIENARLYRETMEKARMEQEMRIAAEIQQSLLPKAARAGSYFRAAAASLPCRSIGGDFYDYVEMADGSLGFALGGVAGKGPPAALLSAMMQGLFAAQAATNDEPSQTITRVNLALYRRGLESRFVTLVYGVLDSAGNMVYCNAGHNPPLIVGASGVRRLERGGPIVGLFEGATYEDERLTLAPGDWLIVFSGGISEAMSASGDDYGEARIIDCIQRNKSLDPSGLLDALFSDVRDFARDAAQSDDITAMVLQYQGDRPPQTSPS